MRARGGLALALLLANGTCGIRFGSCGLEKSPPPPMQDIFELPAKLWVCYSISRECVAMARFMTILDCETYRDLSFYTCEWPSPEKEEIRCKRLPANDPAWTKQRWICSKDVITYEQVRDGGAWIR